MTQEKWHPIKGYEGIYEVSDQGRVRNVKRGGKLMTAHKVTHGYLAYNLSKQGKTRSLLAHRLVAVAFIPNPANKPQVNHIDGVKAHNSVDNLEWVTSEENLHHAKENGLIPDYLTQLKRDPKSKQCRTADLWRSNLKDIREEKGITQEELSEACCVRLDTIQRLESNGMYFRSAGLNTACKLAYALGVNIEALFEYEIAEAIRKEKAWHKK